MRNRLRITLGDVLVLLAVGSLVWGRHRGGLELSPEAAAALIEVRVLAERARLDRLAADASAARVRARQAELAAVLAGITARLDAEREKRRKLAAELERVRGGGG